MTALRNGGLLVPNLSGAKETAGAGSSFRLRLCDPRSRDRGEVRAGLCRGVSLHRS